jgi:hypothetical protein
MKRKTLVMIHIAATIIAAITIGTFFLSSVVAEIDGNETFIREVKERILFTLPVLLMAMPAIGITGNKLAGNSQSPQVKTKQRRMKFVFVNGLTLIILASFLYYHSHYKTIDTVFMVAQLVELVLGLTNLVLISLNIKSGLQLSGRIRRIKRLNA